MADLPITQEESQTALCNLGLLLGRVSLLSVRAVLLSSPLSERLQVRNQVHQFGVPIVFGIVWIHETTIAGRQKCLRFKDALLQIGVHTGKCNLQIAMTQQKGNR